MNTYNAEILVTQFIILAYAEASKNQILTMQ